MASMRTMATPTSLQCQANIQATLAAMLAMKRAASLPAQAEGDSAPLRPDAPLTAQASRIAATT